VPYKSKKQAAFIHAEAARGTAWAKTFVKDAHGTHVQPPDRMKRRGSAHLRARRK
jgi:hypothetical protein